MNLIQRAIAWLKNNEPVVTLNAAAGIATTVAVAVQGAADQVGPEHGWLAAGWIALTWLERHFVTPSGRVGTG